MLYAVIMAGGRGERFWPRSRRMRPKQTLNLVGHRTLIQNTVSRITPLVKTKNIFVVTGKEQRPLIRKQLPHLKSANIIVEPAGRDTAACIGLAALHIEKRDPDGVMIVLPADHLIRQKERFHSSLKVAINLAQESNALITLGIKPSYPSTGYGYIKRNLASGFRIENRRAYQIERFVEKPTRAAALRMVKSGDYFWNSGIFIWRVSSILDGIRDHLPGLYLGLERIRANLGKKTETRIVDGVWKGLKPISIDYGVMEKAKNVCLIPANFGWSDIGSWVNLASLRGVDGEGNTVLGKVKYSNTRNSIIVGEAGHLIGTVGISNLIIVHTSDVTLISSRRHAEDVKSLVREIEKDKQLRKYL